MRLGRPAQVALGLHIGLCMDGSLMDAAIYLGAFWGVSCVVALGCRVQKPKPHDLGLLLSFVTAASAAGNLKGGSKKSPQRQKSIELS